MSPSREVDVGEIKRLLQSFLDTFTQYSEEIYGGHNQDTLDELRNKLQRMEPQVSKYAVEIIGGGTVTVGSFGYIRQIAHIDLLPTALMGGNNELTHNFRDFKARATMMLNRALGCIDARLWPPEEPAPTLLIRDEELKQRCFDLLSAPGVFDRVIREATVILEDRIRGKVTYATLIKLIPQSADRMGETLINKGNYPLKTGRQIYPHDILLYQHLRGRGIDAKENSYRYNTDTIGHFCCVANNKTRNISIHYFPCVRSCWFGGWRETMDLEVASGYY